MRKLDKDDIKMFLDILNDALQDPEPMDIRAFIRHAKSQHWVNYCECLIGVDGQAYPMHGSHSSMLSKLAAQQRHQSVDEYYDTMPHAYYADTDVYAMQITHAICVHYNSQWGIGKPTPDQEASLQKLANQQLIQLRWFEFDKQTGWRKPDVK